MNSIHFGLVDLSFYTGQVPPPFKGCLYSSLFIFIFFTAFPLLNANSVDCDQMSSSAMSDLGLLCLLSFL